LLTALAAVVSIVFGIRAAFLPPRPAPLKVSVLKHGQLQGRFALLMVTTLEKLLLRSQLPGRTHAAGALQLLIIERRPMVMVRAVIGTLFGGLGGLRMPGVHLERGDEIRIEGDHSSVILDGELFEARIDHPIVLKPTAPVPFLRLAA
jgi:hypothetical protein